jgi:hypothetical protein
MSIETPIDPAPRAMTTSTQDCPLCGNDAQYYFVDAQAKKHFLCSNCTQFQISVAAEELLAKASPEWRSSLSNKASAHPKGATLVIERPATPAAGEDSTALSPEYVENSQLPV